MCQTVTEELTENRQNGTFFFFFFNFLIEQGQNGTFSVSVESEIFGNLLGPGPPGSSLLLLNPKVDNRCLRGIFFGTLGYWLSPLKLIKNKRMTLLESVSSSF